MAKALILKARPVAPALHEAARMAIVYGCACALILAGTI
ncbi:hypothetical protein MTsPCn7_11130 [Altererythrobacter sp. MTPC7]